MISQIALFLLLDFNKKSAKVKIILKQGKKREKLLQKFGFSSIINVCKIKRSLAFLGALHSKNMAKRHETRQNVQNS